MRLVGITNKHNLPPKNGVAKSIAEKIKTVLSKQQIKVIDGLFQAIDTSQLSQTVKLVAELVGLPTWLVLQELHYIELVRTLFSYKSVRSLGYMPRNRMITLFPLLSPIEALGISDELSVILKDYPYKVLEDGFGMSRGVSVRYVCELYSLSLTRKDLAKVIRKYFRDKYIVDPNNEGKKVSHGNEMTQIDSGLQGLNLPPLRKSNEHKALRRFLTKSPGLQRVNLSDHHSEVLLTLRWGNLQLSKALSHIDPKGRQQKVDDWDREAMRILLMDDNFETASMFRNRNT